MNFIRVLIGVFAFLLFQFNYTQTYAGKDIESYYKIGTISGELNDAVKKVKTALESKEFEIIGEYHPGKNKNLYVVAFSRKDLQDIVIQKNDRGLLAGILKVGFYKTTSGIEISILNPMYLFHAYLMEDIKNYKSKLIQISNEITEALKTVKNEFTAFGGKVEDEELWEYHYMFGMPYFTDPIELREFTSFEQGLKTIQTNLTKKVGSTVKVYEVIRKDKKVAVFGIALLDPEIGEAHFLPIIGDKHVAAMPYEIILQGKEATMLNGRYRIALHWPELTMGTFTQIMSTPGNIEETFEKIVE